jgi:hypothetical protein
MVEEVEEVEESTSAKICGFPSALICEKGKKSCGLAVLRSCEGLLCVNLRDFTLRKSARTSFLSHMRKAMSGAYSRIRSQNVTLKRGQHAA